ILLWISFYFNYFQNKWLQAGAILVGFVVLAFVLFLIIEKVVLRLTAKTKTKVDDLIFTKIKMPVFWLLIVLGLRISSQIVFDSAIVFRVLESISIIIFVLILAKVINVLIDGWGRVFAKKTKSRLDESLLPLFRKVVNIIFVLVGILWILNIWNINITPYLAGLGIGGLVLGLALQDSLKNIFGGVSLILDQSFAVGDKIQIESGEVGEIVDVGLRSTKIKNYDNQIITIPNGQMANAKIINYVQPNDRIRVVVKFGVEYGTKVEKVKKVVDGVLKKMKDISDDPYMDTVFTEMGDFALLFEARFWVDDYREAYNKKLEATEKIYAALNKAKIGIAFPTQTIHLKKGK
ncbi:mechanosensitive ion channel family protein, partial [Candidatus Woesearchaeota archaeon]|nr:mechanosensitive ion channel family protein [Candidatus Woesearchaeota archaeon]